MFSEYLYSYLCMFKVIILKLEYICIVLTPSLVVTSCFVRVMIVAIVKRISGLDFVIFKEGICEVKVIAVRASHNFIQRPVHLSFGRVKTVVDG